MRTLLSGELYTNPQVACSTRYIISCVIDVSRDGFIGKMKNFMFGPYKGIMQPSTAVAWCRTGTEYQRGNFQRMDQNAT